MGVLPISAHANHKVAFTAQKIFIIRSLCVVIDGIRSG
jgi:hypothetical protein